MKDVFQVFEENLGLILKSLENDNYDGSSSISSDLISTALLAGFSDGVFIGEVLEGVFDQVSPMMSRFELSEEDKQGLRGAIRNQVELIANSFKEEDKNRLYSALREVRTVTTQFQFKCMRFGKVRADIEPRVRVARAGAR
jgi:hypothetical protein